MPAIYAHLRFGREVEKVLPAPFKTLLSDYPEAFALGTQGPDILFYHHPMKKNDIRKRGTYLHTLSGERFFAEQAKKLTNTDEELERVLSENGALAAYLCGFLCHYTLDTLCHPFIDANSNEAVSHGKIESELDKYFLRKDGKPIRGYNTATPISGENGTKASCSTVLDVPEDNIAISIKTMRKINGWFSNKCELFHSFAHTFLKIAKMERKFGDMFLHKKDDPLCAPLNETLNETFNGGIEQAAKFIEYYFKNLKEIAETQHINQDFFRCNFSGIKIGYITEND